MAVSISIKQLSRVTEGLTYETVSSCAKPDSPFTQQQ